MLLSDLTCRFCEAHNRDFQHEATMDKHYSEECVMLTSCELCDLVVEAQKLNSHMMRECVNRQFVSECQVCGEVSSAEH